MQQQSAGERLRGVSWAYRVEPQDTEVLSALLATVNNDASVNVRMAAVDALHAFGASPVTRRAIVQSIPKQTSPLVQIALIDLLTDLKVTDAAPELKKLSSDGTVDVNVRERAKAALGKLVQ
jgi:HEAT repeat protein